MVEFLKKLSKITYKNSLLADKNYEISRSARNDRVFNDFGN